VRRADVTAAEADGAGEFELALKVGVEEADEDDGMAGEDFTVEVELEPEAALRSDGPALRDPSSPGHSSLDRIVVPNPASSPRSMTRRKVPYTSLSSGLISFSSRNRRTVILAAFPEIRFEASCSSSSTRVFGTDREDVTWELADGSERYFEREAGVRWKRTFGS
jgi:hypothetical protein